jgi:hypothetical protein
VRQLSREEAKGIILSWLYKCNSINRLSFNIRKVDDVLNRLGKQYPIARANLEGDNKLLFQKLKEEGVIY